MNYTIRPFCASDVFYIRTLSADEYCGANMLTAQSLKTIDTKTEKCFVAVADNEIIGYIHGYFIPSKLMLPYFMYVKQEFRGQKIGTALLKYFEEHTDAPCSIIYYEKSLHDYYCKQGYLAGETKVAVKTITQLEV